MASTIGLRPPNVSSPVFSKGLNADGKDKSKPRFRVTKMISCRVRFYGSEAKVGLG